MSRLLRVRNLSVGFGPRGREIDVVHDVSFDLDAGETLAIVGESGSGKSVLAMSINRLVDFGGGRISRGSIEYYSADGTPPRAAVPANSGGGVGLPGTIIDLAVATESQLEHIRGRQIGMIFQEPMSSLNPVLSIGAQIEEIFRVQQGLSGAAARTAAREALARVRIPDAERRLRYAPHQLSGGMLQRVMIAMALAAHPRLLIADEPTTALDVTIQAQILGLLTELQRDSDTGMIFITHDIGLVAGIADRILVMQQGRVVEQGPLDRVLDAPQHEYTRHLLETVPHFSAGAAARQDAPADPATVLEVRDLTVRFPVRGGFLRRRSGNVHAVESISFSLARGETLGIIGESGCGKSTAARAILDLVTPTRGMIDTTSPVQIVFQNPYASLNPRLTVAALLAEPCIAIGQRIDATVRSRMRMLLDHVGLPEDSLERYPHEFSGGQRQRLCIARALMLNPSVMVLDEAVSALDVSVQARVLDLLVDLQREFGLAYLFVTHDMAVVERIAHRIAVIHAGQIVEIGPTATVLANPRHGYTRQLIDAVPSLSRRHGDYPVDTTTIPSLVRPAGWEPAAATWREAGPGHRYRDDPRRSPR